MLKNEAKKCLVQLRKQSLPKLQMLQTYNTLRHHSKNLCKTRKAEYEQDKAIKISSVNSTNEWWFLVKRLKVSTI